MISASASASASGTGAGAESAGRARAERARRAASFILDDVLGDSLIVDDGTVPWPVTGSRLWEICAPLYHSTFPLQLSGLSPMYSGSSFVVRKPSASPFFSPRHPDLTCSIYRSIKTSENTSAIGRTLLPHKACSVISRFYFRALPLGHAPRYVLPYNYINGLH